MIRAYERRRWRVSLLLRCVDRSVVPLLRGPAAPAPAPGLAATTTRLSYPIILLREGNNFIKAGHMPFTQCMQLALVTPPPPLFMSTRLGETGV